MKTIIQMAFAITLFLFVSCGSDSTPANDPAKKPETAPKVEQPKPEKKLTENGQFFNKFKAFCGKTYKGKLLSSYNPEFFKGKDLNLILEYCNDKEVSFHFIQGEDKSQKWKLTKNNDDLSFKLHITGDNGKPKKITNFGGTSETASGTIHVFPADKATAKMIPPAKDNKWVLNMDEAGKKLTYTILRGSKKRFSAVFNLANPK